MGTAGLDITRLAGLLEQKKVECSLVDDDSAFDHCLLRLSSRRRPGVIAFLEYENQGMEPRLVGLSYKQPDKKDYPVDGVKTLELKGARDADPAKIAEWIEREYLNSAS